jgi:hypothetical protein
MSSSLFIDLTLEQQEFISGGSDLSGFDGVLAAAPGISLPVSTTTDLDAYVSDEIKKAVNSRLAAGV